MNKREISAVLAAAGQQPRHRFGQNFMIDAATLAAVAEAGQIATEDVVLEVGPGAGNLTRLLSAAASNGAVLAVDIDKYLLPAAQAAHADLKNVTWMLADVLSGKHAVEPAVLEKLRELRAAHPKGEVKLVSNLPYNVASPLVAEILIENAKREGQNTKHGESSGNWFSRMAFTVQWEVGARMVAGPGRRDYGPLGILIQALARAEIVRKIPPGVFWPAPKVNSALVVVVPERERTERVRDAGRLSRFLAGIFAHRRQTIGNALKHALREKWTAEKKAGIEARGFDLSRRPEDFSVEELIALEATVNGEGVKG